MCVCMCVCVCVCVYVCMCVCVYVCMHVCFVWPHTKHASRHDNRQAERDKDILMTIQHARKFLAKRDSLTHDGNPK